MSTAGPMSAWMRPEYIVSLSLSELPQAAMATASAARVARAVARTARLEVMRWSAPWSQRAKLLQRRSLGEPNPRCTVTQRPFAIAVVACLALAAGSLALAHALAYDSWAWLVWGRELAGLHLDTSSGPS